MTIEFKVSDIICATPSEIYDTWLSSEGHSQMTGSVAHASNEIGFEFDAWDGYISGTNVVLDPGRRIVQSWRTTEFGNDHTDSQIEITLEPVSGGTLMTLLHSSVPDGQGHYEQGWQTHYFDPMKAFFIS
jgi:activator of HSP90 ATPase